MGHAIADVEQGFELYTSGKVIQPSKVCLTGKDNSKEGFNILPGIVEIDDREVFGCKVLGSNTANTQVGLPRATGLLALFDGDTKVPLAVMDMQVISAMRTGAVSGLAARELVPAETESVGLVGAGVNMRTQLLAVSHELPNLKRATVTALNGSKYKFAEEMAARTGLEITPTLDSRQLIEDNAFNILCTPKPTKPLIEPSWLRAAGSTIFNISGIATPPESLADMDRLVTDSWDDCKHRNTQSLPAAAQDGFVDEADIEELGDVMRSGNGRQGQSENIFFCPVGMAFEDVIVAWRVYNTALKKNIGQKVTLWANPQWI